MRLVELSITGLKAASKTYTFEDKNIVMFRGENGSGKTTALQALHLLLTGKAPRAAGRSEASSGKEIMLLSSGGEIQIVGRWDNGVRVERRWSRNGTGVKEVLRQSIQPDISGVRESQGLISLYFGRISEVWDPSSFFELSAAKMRAKLITSVSCRPIREVVSMLPDKLPPWAAPGSLDVPVETWLQAALKDVNSRIRDEQAEVRRSSKQLEEIPLSGSTDDTKVKALLEDLRNERVKIANQDALVAGLNAKEIKRELLMKQVSELDIEIEIDREQIKELAPGVMSLQEIDEKVRAAQDQLKEVGRAEELKEQAEELRASVEESRSSERDLKRLRASFESVEQEFLESAKQPFEDAITAVVGKKTTVDLSGGGCRILVDGVDLTGLSDGETLRFIPGIAAGLAATTESKWVPLPIDRFESVSGQDRADFLSALHRLAESGAVSQVFIATCQDSTENTDLCQVFDL